MKSLLLLLLVVAIIPLISSTENDIPTVESVETATQISSSEELNDAENPTEEIKLVEDSKNETDKGLRTSPKKLTCLPLKGLNITSVSKFYSDSNMYSEIENHLAKSHS